MRSEIHNVDYSTTVLVVAKRIFANPFNMNG